jgi:hypothetical protein
MIDRQKNPRKRAGRVMGVFLSKSLKALRKVLLPYFIFDLQWLFGRDTSADVRTAE